MKHHQTALQKAMNTTMAKSLNNLLAAEEIARINVKTSKMTIDQAKVYLTSELEKWQSLITEKQYQDRNVEQSVLQHVKELLFLVNNLMQAPTVVHERERFRTQLTVCKKVYKNSLTPLPRIEMWSVKQGPLFKEISSPHISGKANIY